MDPAISVEFVTHDHVPVEKPEIARPSMEACGIDVFETARRTGFQISILKDRNLEFMYFGMVLID